MSNGCIRCHVPPGSLSQNSYTGFGQPLDPAVNVTSVPTGPEPAGVVTVAAEQPLSVTVDAVSYTHLTLPTILLV